MSNQSQAFNLFNLYEKTFGSKPYVIQEDGQLSQDSIAGFQLLQSDARTTISPKGSIIKESYLGVEVWLPIRFFDGPSLLMYLPYVVVKISRSKNIVKTSLTERGGSVHEMFNADDYQIGVKGFLIDENREFPEAQLQKMKELFEFNGAVQIDNALTNIFLTDPSLSSNEQRRVVIKSLDFAEVQGGRLHVRPFSMELESDAIFTLELED